MILIPVWRRATGAAVAAALLLAGAACSDRGSASDGVRVVASFYPLYEAARQVGGTRATAVNLTPAGAEPHDLELTTRDLEAIQTADLVLYLGGGFQPGLADALESRSRPSVDLLEGLNVIAGDEPDEPDPHVWLDPLLMKSIVDRTASQLSTADPQGAEAYRQNAATFVAELDALHGEFSDALEACATRVLVTSHAAFGYLATRYGLRQESIAGVSPEAEPEPRRLAELADLVRRERITTVFTETLVSARVAQTLARAAGVKTAVLDPLEGLSKEDAQAGVGYLDVMRRNLAALRSGLGCP